MAHHYRPRLEQLEGRALPDGAALYLEPAEVAVAGEAVALAGRAVTIDFAPLPRDRPYRVWVQAWAGDTADNWRGEFARGTSPFATRAFFRESARGDGWQAENESLTEPLLTLTGKRVGERFVAIARIDITSLEQRQPGRGDVNLPAGQRPLVTPTGSVQVGSLSAEEAAAVAVVLAEEEEQPWALS